MDSYQYRVFKERYSFLQEGIKSSMAQMVKKSGEVRKLETVTVGHELACALHCAKLISSQTLQSTTAELLTPERRASHVLKALDSHIKTQPESLYDFMVVLRSMQSLRYLYRDLNERLPEQLQLDFPDSSLQEGQDEVDSGPFAGSTQISSPSSIQNTHSYMYVAVQPLHLPESTVTGVTSSTVHQIHRSASYNIEELTADVPQPVLVCETTEVVLCDIARNITSHDTLFPYFGLSRAEGETISLKFPNKPERQRQELLFEWKDKMGKRATYKELLVCFCQAKRIDLVYSTRETLMKHHHQNADATGQLLKEGQVSTHRAVNETMGFSPTDDNNPVVPFQRQQSNGLGSVGKRTSSPSLYSQASSGASGLQDTSIPESCQVFSRFSSGESSAISVDDGDEEMDDTEEMQRDLDRVTSKCFACINDLQQKLKKKDKEVKRLSKELDQKKRELTACQLRSMHISGAEVNRVRKELQITRDYAISLEDEKCVLESELQEMQAKFESCESQNRGLYKEIARLRRLLTQSQRDAFTSARDKASLEEQLRELKNSIESWDNFLQKSNFSCRSRSQSI